MERKRKFRYILLIIMPFVLGLAFPWYFAIPLYAIIFLLVFLPEFFEK